MQNIEEVYNKYSKIVYKYIFCLCKDKELSEEIVQETFLVAVKDINKFEGKSKISTWLCQIAKNIWYQNLRKEKKYSKVALENVEDIAMFEEQFEEAIFEKERKLELFKKLQTLDEQTRNVIILRILGNLSYEEIGEVMNKTASWARVVYFRGKEKLKGENYEGM